MEALQCNVTTHKTVSGWVPDSTMDHHDRNIVNFIQPSGTGECIIGVGKSTTGVGEYTIGIEEYITKEEEDKNALL